MLQLGDGVDILESGLLDLRYIAQEAKVGIDFDNILGHQQKRLTIRLHEGLFDLPKVEAQVIFGGIIAAFAPKIADDVAAAHLPGRLHQDQGDDSGSLAADLIADIRTVQQKSGPAHKRNIQHTHTFRSNTTRPSLMVIST